MKECEEELQELHDNVEGLNDIRDDIKEIRAKLLEMQRLISPKTRAQEILDSENVYNGHNQDSVDSMNINDALQLCEELSDELGRRGDLNNIVSLNIHPDYSGAIYHDDEDGTLLLSITQISTAL
jgi:hypothetical protein